MKYHEKIFRLGKSGCKALLKDIENSLPFKMVTVKVCTERGVMGGEYKAYLVKNMEELIDGIGTICEKYGLPKGCIYFPSGTAIPYVTSEELRDGGEYAVPRPWLMTDSYGFINGRSLFSSGFLYNRVPIPAFHVITWSEFSGFKTVDMCHGDDGEPFFGIYPQEVYSNRVLRATFYEFCKKYGFNIPITGPTECDNPNFEMLKSIDEHYDLWYEVVVDYIQSLKEA